MNFSSIHIWCSMPILPSLSYVLFLLMDTCDFNTFYGMKSSRMCGAFLTHFYITDQLEDIWCWDIDTSSYIYKDAFFVSSNRNATQTRWKTSGVFKKFWNGEDFSCSSKWVLVLFLCEFLASASSVLALSVGCFLHSYKTAINNEGGICCTHPLSKITRFLSVVLFGSLSNKGDEFISGITAWAVCTS